jgi:hypothetical protein
LSGIGPRSEAGGSPGIGGQRGPPHAKSDLHHRGRQNQDEVRLKFAARAPLTFPEAVNIHLNISAKYKLPGRHATGAPGLNS